MINEELMIYYGLGALFLVIICVFLSKRKKKKEKKDITKEVTLNYSSVQYVKSDNNKTKRRGILSAASVPKYGESNIDQIVRWTESTSYNEDPTKEFYKENTITTNAVNNEQDKYKLNILLVDDSMVVRKYISDLLNGHDYNVITKNDGSEGLIYLNTSLLKPDLIISDIEMPVMDGFTFINTLREDNDNDEIPVLVISAHAESHFSLMSEGKIQGFIKKPFSNEDLLKQIDYLLGL